MIPWILCVLERDILMRNFRSSRRFVCKEFPKAIFLSAWLKITSTLRGCNRSELTDNRNPNGACSYKNITKRFQKYQLSNTLLLSFLETMFGSDTNRQIWNHESSLVRRDVLNFCARSKPEKHNESHRLLYRGTPHTPYQASMGPHVARSPYVYTCDIAVSHLTIPKVPPGKEAGANSWNAKYSLQSQWFFALIKKRVQTRLKIPN